MELYLASKRTLDTRCEWSVFVVKDVSTNRHVRLTISFLWSVLALEWMWKLLQFNFEQSHADSKTWGPVPYFLSLSIVAMDNDAGKMTRNKKKLFFRMYGPFVPPGMAHLWGPVGPICGALFGRTVWIGLLINPPMISDYFHVTLYKTFSILFRYCQVFNEKCMQFRTLAVKKDGKTTN